MDLTFVGRPLIADLTKMVLDWFGLLRPWDKIDSDWLEFGCRWFVDFAVGDTQKFSSRSSIGLFL